MFAIGPLDMNWRPRCEAAWLWMTGDKPHLFCVLSLKKFGSSGRFCCEASKRSLRISKSC